jgi:DNA helicase-2/ATP-dependent DNA helicase PcrA
VVKILPESDPSPRLTVVRPGDRVSHDKFGDGTVVSTSGSGQSAHAKIAFDTAGSKSFALRYAPLRFL